MKNIENKNVVLPALSAITNIVLFGDERVKNKELRNIADRIIKEISECRDDYTGEKKNP